MCQYLTWDFIDEHYVRKNIDQAYLDSIVDIGTGIDSSLLDDLLELLICGNLEFQANRSLGDGFMFICVFVNWNRVVKWHVTRHGAVIVDIVKLRRTSRP